MEIHLEALHKEINWQKTKLPVFYIQTISIKVIHKQPIWNLKKTKKQKTKTKQNKKKEGMKIEYTNYGILGHTRSTNSLSQLEKRKLQIQS